ncbi:MAG: TIGR03084 family protein [Pseudomonadales bacterium]|nr:TIGR03084 family protein [Pseudomonadales bacterium]MBO6702176.1 TIGR03084 family protein [Pseudomonadales bacterium]MBO7006721.1 TIGR03084 family protein [Pseudomonadales bacterium]
MFQQAADLLEEGTALKAVLDQLEPADWSRETPFKSWTVNQVVQHLHGSDKMAVLSLKDADGFAAAMSDPKTVAQTMNPTIEGEELLNTWWAYFSEMCELLGASDPKRRVPWFGPDMGVMMFTTARQMETWSHGQDIFDMFGETRVNTDRLKNIAVIGVKTYGWTFANRKMDVPGPAPYVKLTAPGGGTWEFGEPNSDNYVAGDAAEFCHVVTQGRHIADVNLDVVGEPAQKWMAIAQCFAGPPEDPPAPGSRTVNF